MRLALVLGVVGLVMAAGPARGQDVVKGAKVYADQKCAMCHSIGGVGNKKGPLDGVGSKYSSADLHAWIIDAKGMTEKAKADRKPPMKNYALPKDDVDALVAYMASLKK
ncbi:MAG TPA: cytochrome c [Vicinamibacterales bacterium]|jgi:mono/diheme cytochrome c family protein|nr:cytochrome c [Vicinamibacterales bacterium]